MKKIEIDTIDEHTLTYEFDMRDDIDREENYYMKKGSDMHCILHSLVYNDFSGFRYGFRNIFKYDVLDMELREEGYSESEIKAVYKFMDKYKDAVWNLINSYDLEL